MNTITDKNAPEAKEQNRLLRNVLYAFFVGGASAQPLGSFIPFLRSAYGLSYDISGIMLSCQSAGNLVSVLLSGFLPSYLGRRRSILATSIWMAIGYLLFASGVGAPAVLVFACFMTGFARGGNSNFANTMISTLPAEKATMGFNLQHGTFAAGALLSPILLVVFANKFPVIGWRMVAWLLFGLCLSQIAVYAKMPLPQEAPKGLKNVDRSFLKVKEFWLAALMLFIYISMEYAVVGWLVTYFQDVGILDASRSQLMNSLLWLMIFVGRMVTVSVAGKISRNKLLVFAGLGLTVFFFVMFFGTTQGTVVFALACVGFFMAPIYPTAIAFGSDCIKGNDLGCSLLVFIGSSGGVITPAVVGFIAENAGIRAGMSLIVVFVVLLLAMIFISVFMVRKKS